MYHPHILRHWHDFFRVDQNWSQLHYLQFGSPLAQHIGHCIDTHRPLRVVGGSKFTHLKDFAKKTGSANEILGIFSRMIGLNGGIPLDDKKLVGLECQDPSPRLRVVVQQGDKSQVLLGHRWSSIHPAIPWWSRKLNHRREVERPQEPPFFWVVKSCQVDYLLYLSLFLFVLLFFSNEIRVFSWSTPQARNHQKHGQVLTPCRSAPAAFRTVQVELRKKLGMNEIADKMMKSKVKFS